MSASPLSEALEKIRERVEKATKGPWKTGLDVFAEDTGVEVCVNDESISMLFTSGTDESNPQANGAWNRARLSQPALDAEFMAAARTDVPALIKACEILAGVASVCHCGEPFDHEELCPLNPSSRFRSALSAAAEALEKEKS